MQEIGTNGWVQATEADSRAQDAVLPLKQDRRIWVKGGEPPCIKTQGSLHHVLFSLCHPGELEEDAEEKTTTSVIVP